MNTKSQELKSLQVQLSKELNMTETLKEDIKNKQKTLSSCFDRIKYLQKTITEFTIESEKAVISEHAILRYLERVKNIDIEGLQKEILDDHTSSLIKFANGNCQIVKNDLTLVIKNNVVVTIK